MPSNEDGPRNYALTQLYFYLTEGCNLKCRHCWIAPKYQSPDKVLPSLKPEVFQHIIQQAKPLGLAGVKLTGGEPLMHPQIFDLLEIIRSEELRLVVETNGVLCTPELAKKLAACKSPFISVSVDGSDAKTHEWVRGVKGCFDAAMRGIRNLVNAGFKPQIIMSVMQHNREQMESLVEMAEALGAGSVKFNIVQPTARGDVLHETGQTLNITELVEIGKWVETVLSKKSKISIYYNHPMAFRSLSSIFGANGDGCGVCGILGILGVLSDGSYALCGIGETVPEMVFGKAQEDALEGVWKNTKLLNDLREGLPKRLTGICGDCLMNTLCLASCIAQNYYRSKDVWAPYWYCEEAHNDGLFPQTRMRPV
jgi:SynChlorMet cassette radical SAM/SPASM protein ScmF